MNIRKALLGVVGVGTLFASALLVTPANAAQSPWTTYNCTGLRAVTAFSSTSGFTSHNYDGNAPSGAGYAWSTSWASGGSRQSWSGMKTGEYSIYGATSISSYGATCYNL